MIDCVFVNNNAEDSGGGAWAGEASPVVQGCTFTANQSPSEGGGLSCQSGASVSIFECGFIRNHAKSGAGVCVSGGATAAISSCTFVANQADEWGTGVMSLESATVTLDHSIVVFGLGTFAVGCNEGTATASCCDLYGNQGGDWLSCVADQGGQAGNFSANPLFCGPENPGLPYSLQRTSPCSPDQNPTCGLIGAWGVGCGLSAVLEAPTSSSSVRIAPNPSGGGCRILLSASSPRQFHLLEILDSSGRMIRRIAVGPETTLFWDGRDAEGRALPAGVYTARLQGPDGAALRRIVRIR